MKIVLILTSLFLISCASDEERKYKLGLKEEEAKIYNKCLQEEELTKKECKKKARKIRENFDKFLKSLK